MKYHPTVDENDKDLEVLLWSDLKDILWMKIQRENLLYIVGSYSSRKIQLQIVFAYTENFWKFLSTKLTGFLWGTGYSVGFLDDYFVLWPLFLFYCVIY